MLEDFLSNRPAIQSPNATESEPRSSTFQPFFAARSAGLSGKRTAEFDAEPECPRLEAPEIELVRESGEVRRIIVTCKCCEKITIDCEY